MRSMTGHGRGAAEVAGRRVTVEVRAVNHRYLDLKLRAPYPGGLLEERMTNGLRKRAERGSFSVTVREETSPRATAAVQVNLDLARSAARALEELRAAVGIDEPVPLALIAAQPGVLSSAAADDDVEAIAAAVLPALDAALIELVAMRRREGATLAEDLGSRLEALGAFASDVEARARTAPEEHRRRLEERLAKLLAGSDIEVDPGRLAHEVAVIADRTDTTEEVVRLRSHLTQMRALLEEDSPVGRRLDFLVQELGREVNTIGSKSQSAEVGALVVTAKAEVEKIREQVQNVE